MEYIIHILLQLEIYAILVLALNLQLGYSGLLNLSIAASYGIGAYLYASMSVAGVDFFTASAATIFGNWLFSAIVIWAATRFRNDYFVLVGIGVQLITIGLIKNLPELANGVDGISGIVPPSFLSSDDHSYWKLLVLASSLLGVIALLSYRTYRSPLGRDLLAFKHDPTAATGLGKHPLVLRTMSIGISTLFISCAGILHCLFYGSIEPDTFGIDESIAVLFMLVLGGTGNIKGPLCGAALYVTCQEALTFLNLDGSADFSIRIILFSAAVIGVLYFRPQGIWGKFKMWQK